MTMMYIVPFNGFWSNTPVAISVGMGLNAYFTYGLVLGMKIPWQTALGIVFLSGVIFVHLSFTRFRVWVMHSIPMNLRRAISAGIGAFILGVLFTSVVSIRKRWTTCIILVLKD